MADCSVVKSEDSTSTNLENKPKGICRIRPEFIIEDHIRTLSGHCLSEIDKRKMNNPTIANIHVDLIQDEPPVKKSKLVQNDDNKVTTTTTITTINETEKSDDEDIEIEPNIKRTRLNDDRREKLKGQNKARPPPFKASKENNLCPWIVDQAEDEPVKECLAKNCTFMHDRLAYLKIKEPDVGPDCYLFNFIGRCPRGLACRFASKHITADGFNVVDKEKYTKFTSKSPMIKNKIPQLLQEKLRKRKYNFSLAEKIVKSNDPSIQKIDNKDPVSIDRNIKRKIADGDGDGDGNNINLEADNVTVNKLQKVDNKVMDDTNKMEFRLGPVPDDDLIRLRPCEKKKIDWKDKILLSPLTTVGNLPFRRICKEYGADITCGEMALAPKILKGAHEEWALVKRHEIEDIFGVQICGNNPGVLTRCAQLLNTETEVNFIDLNLGCPIDLIYKQGGGSGMLNRTNILQTVVKSVSQVLDIPLTIKTRTGVYMDKPVAHNLMSKFRDCGASMITVHGRSREQRYTKSADWDYIELCAKNAMPVPVFGNGDILSYDDYQRARSDYPSVQGVTIGRGALIKPWIFREIKEKKLFDISSSERLDILKKYANYGLEHWGSDTRGVETTRRFMLEWISFFHRYVPVGILEQPPQRINERPPFYKGRDDIETLLASSNCANWIKISEMFLGKVPEGFHFLPKHKANSWK